MRDEDRSKDELPPDQINQKSEDTHNTLILLERERVLRRQFETLSEVSIAISSDLGIEQVAGILLDKLGELVDYTNATLQLINGDTRRLIAARGIDPKSITAWQLRPLSQDRLVSRIVQSKEILILPHPTPDEDWEVLPITSDTRSWVGIPLVFDDQVVGLLTLDHKTPGFYGQEHKQLMKLYANQASIAVKHTDLFSELEQRVQKLTEIQERLEDTHSLAMIGLVYGEDLHLTSNKLGAARAFAKYIYRDSEDTRVQDKALRIAQNIEEVLQLFEVIRQTIHPPEPTPFNIVELVQEVIDLTVMSSCIKTKFEQKLDNPIVIGFRRQLGQVFRVVIYNAVDALEGEGILSVETRKALTGDDFVEVLISDTGHGIPDEVQRDIFEIGGTKSPKRKGSGFGLAWSRLFLRWYKGDITFSTFEGKGTTMHILVPRDMTAVRS